MKKFFAVISAVSVLAVVVGLGAAIFDEASKAEAVEAEASFARVTHQSGRIGGALGDARVFIGDEATAVIGEIADIDDLLDEWTPRFQKAQAAYRKFDASITAAEASAEAYFGALRALTERFHSQESRDRAKAHDDAEFEAYRQWRERAYGVRVEAFEILKRLSDMDTTLHKLKLRSAFSFNAAAFDAVPSDILALEGELAQFQVASDNLRESIASPFEAA